MQIEVAPTRTFRVWIAGNYDDALRETRAFCSDEGACFAISPCAYAYTGGMEDGVVVTLINYPRFPAPHFEMLAKTERLAERLRGALYQQSYTIEGPDETTWHSHRAEMPTA